MTSPVEDIVTLVDGREAIVTDVRDSAVRISTSCVRHLTEPVRRISRGWLSHRDPATLLGNSRDWYLRSVEAASGRITMVCDLDSGTADLQRTIRGRSAAFGGYGMRGTAILGLCAAALITAQAGAGVLYDSNGFSFPEWGMEFEGHDGWVSHVYPETAVIGAGIVNYGDGNLFVYLADLEETPGAYGVWSHSLAPTSDPIVSTTWWQTVNGGVFGVALYDGATQVAAVQLGDGTGGQYQLDANFTTNTATLYIDGAFNRSFATSGSTKVDSVGLVAFAPSGLAYFDNLVVTSSVPEPSLLAAIGIGSAVLMLPRRRAAEIA